MRPFIFCLAGFCVWATPVASRPSNQLSSFDLSGATLLKGFRPAAIKPFEIPSHMRAENGAPEAFHRRFFRGASEIRYHVLLFPTTKALDDWDRAESNFNPSWGSVSHRKLRPRSAASGTSRDARLVNRVMIIVYSHPHPEAFRRNPDGTKGSLTSQALARLTPKVADELSARARRLPENRD